MFALKTEQHQHIFGFLCLAAYDIMVSFSLAFPLMARWIQPLQSSKLFTLPSRKGERASFFGPSWTICPSLTSPVANRWCYIDNTGKSQIPDLRCVEGRRVKGQAVRITHWRGGDVESVTKPTTESFTERIEFRTLDSLSLHYKMQG